MAKTTNRSRPDTNLWDVLLRIVNRAFSSGYALPLIFGVIFLVALEIVTVRLDSRDLKELIESVFAPWVAALGWLLFISSSVIYALATRWMRTKYEAEIVRQRDIIERLLPPEKEEKFELKSP
jgi:hypothetical protein